MQVVDGAVVADRDACLISSPLAVQSEARPGIYLLDVLPAGSPSELARPCSTSVCLAHMHILRTRRVSFGRYIISSIISPCKVQTTPPARVSRVVESEDRTANEATQDRRLGTWAAGAEPMGEGEAAARAA